MLTDPASRYTNLHALAGYFTWLNVEDNWFPTKSSETEMLYWFTADNDEGFPTCGTPWVKQVGDCHLIVSERKGTDWRISIVRKDKILFGPTKAESEYVYKVFKEVGLLYRKNFSFTYTYKELL